MAGCSRSPARPGPPDSVRCARLSPVKRPLSGKVWRRTTIIHRTIRWCTGLSGEPTVICANGRPCNPRATRGPRQRSAGGTGLSGTPTAPELQRSSAPEKEGDRAPDKLQDLSGGAPDCPVRHPTESKYCLPKWIPTAPRPLRSIKGTPRRLQNVYKCSQQLYTSLGSILSLSLLCKSL